MISEHAQYQLLHNTTYFYFIRATEKRSSLIYKTSARHERHKFNMSATLATRVSATQVLHDWHKCHMSATRTTRVKNFDFDNDMGKNIFSHPYIYYKESEKLQGQEQFHTKNYLSKMSCFYAKMHLKSAPKKLNFLMAKAISKSCTLDCSCKCSCTFPHSYAQ